MTVAADGTAVLAGITTCSDLPFPTCSTLSRQRDTEAGPIAQEAKRILREVLRLRRMRESPDEAAPCERMQPPPDDGEARLRCDGCGRTIRARDALSPKCLLRRCLGTLRPMAADEPRTGW